MATRPAWQGLLCAAPIAAALALLVTANEAAAQPAPLNSSVLIFDETTLLQAPSLVDRAADLGNRRVMVVVTMHCRLTPEFKVTEYGMVGDRRLQWKAPLHPGNFFPVNDERREAFSVALAAVFRRAAARGMDLAVLPHLDAYGRVEEWRNYFDFDPLDRHGGESYETALVSPIIEALLAAREGLEGEPPRVQFSLAGEMGRSVFAHAEYYDEIGRYIRRRLGPERTEIGVSLNHNEVGGGHELSSEDRLALQRLLDGCDFIGFSHYRPFAPPARVDHFSAACDAFAEALRGQGVSLPAATPLHFSEVAIGGAPPRRGSATPALAAGEPWQGTGDASRSPWRSSAMKDFRSDYHARLVEFLATQPGDRRVEAAYLWSEGSWDPQGMLSRRFVDRKITGAIRAHNEEVAEAWAAEEADEVVASEPGDTTPAADAQPAADEPPSQTEE